MCNDLDLLTRQQLSEKWELPISTLDYLVQTKQIPFYRVSKRNVRFRESELLEWLETRRDLPYRKNKATE